jgi:hypothetical protein
VNETSAVLYVNDATFSLLKDISIISKIYPMVLSVHPEIISLYFSNSSIKSFMKDKKIELYSIETI